MSADYADLRVGTRVRFSPNWCRTHGPVGTVVRVADDPRIVFPAVVEFDHAPEEPRRCTLHELTILPDEDAAPSDDAGGETEGRVERSTGTTTPAPCPSAADVIAAADDFLRVAQEQQDHYDNRRPLHGDAMEDLVRERFEALRAAVRAFP